MSTNSKYVEAVYETRSFSKAAKSLFISQPALSIAINHIEEELGCKLFDRSITPIQPTDACEYYLQQQRKIQAIEKEMKDYFLDIQELQQGSFSIGSMSYYCCWTIPHLISEFKKQYPNINVSLYEEANNRELYEHMKNGDYDFVLSTNEKLFGKMNKTLLSHEHLILAVPSDWDICQKNKKISFTAEDIINNKHRNTKKKGLSLKKLENYPYISLRKESDLYTRAITLFQNQNAEANTYMYVDQMPTEYFMTQNGYGYSIIRDGTLNIVPKEKENKVLYFNIDDSLAIRNLYLYYRDKDYLSHGAKAFLSSAMKDKY